MYSSVERTSSKKKFDFNNDIGSLTNGLTLSAPSEERAKDYIGNNSDALFSNDEKTFSELNDTEEEKADVNASRDEFEAKPETMSKTVSEKDSETDTDSETEEDGNKNDSPKDKKAKKKSLFLTGSIADTPKRKRASHGIGKSGNELKLSAQADEDARDYIGDFDTPLPEKMKMRDGVKDKSEDEDHGTLKDMKTVKSSKDSDGNSQPKDAGGFEFDTGWVDFGISNVDGHEKGESMEDAMKTPGEKRMKQGNKPKKSNVFVSFQSNYDDDDSRRVKTSREKKIHVGGANYIKSNDESLQTGAEYMESDADKPRLLRTKWERISTQKSNEGTYDDVVPFHQSGREMSKIKDLRDMARESGSGRTEIQKAITGIQTYKNKKDSMKRDFDKKFDRKISLVKEEYRSPSNFWLLLLQKKKEREEELEGNTWFRDPSDDIPSNERIIDGIVKDTASETFQRK